MVNDALTYFFLAGHTMQICQNDNGSEFKAAVLLVMQRFGIKVINGRPYHPESQGMVEQSNGYIHAKINAWKDLSGLTNWDIALGEQICMVCPARKKYVNASFTMAADLSTNGYKVINFYEARGHWANEREKIEHAAQYLTGRMHRMYSLQSANIHTVPAYIEWLKRTFRDHNEQQRLRDD
jgi:hypothetical protein